MGHFICPKGGSLYLASNKYSNRLLTRLRMLNENMPKADKVDIQEVQKAMFYAKKYHGGQKRQTGEPYCRVSHRPWTNKCVNSK